MMLLWLYKVVIHPMVTNASLVWWTKTEQITVRNELAKVQRLVCVAITGAMKSAPTKALDVLLNLAPLHVEITKEAALRLLHPYRYLPGDFSGHMKILNRFPELIEMNKTADRMPNVYNFAFPFEIRISDRQEWSNGSEFEPQAIVFYTDGSKTEEGTGLGVYGPSLRYSEGLRHLSSVFQAEAGAIEICARHCTNDASLHGRKIYICSDSQAALKALGSFTIKSKLFLSCLEALKSLASRCHLSLIGVPGHQGIERNKIADELAWARSPTLA